VAGIDYWRISITFAGSRAMPRQTSSVVILGRVFMSRVLTSIVGVSTAMSAAILGLAVPAHAATVGNVNVVCQFGNVIAFIGGTSVSGTTGDTIDVDPPSGATSLNVTLSGVTGAASVSGASETYTLLGSGPAYMTFTAVGLGCAGQSITLSINGGSPSSGSSDSAEAPPALLQQFGMLAQGTCDAAQPSGLDWSGVASGGWSESWAEWVNGGLGGAVCTRTLTYRPQLSAWVSN
jgi:hypothetical protein